MLTEEDRARLDERFPAGLRLRQTGSNVRAPRTAPRTVVLIMGLPAAGKSTAAHTFVERGYVRVNRDETGGSLRGLLPANDRNSPPFDTLNGAASRSPAQREASTRL
jgi:hypothetical protein